MAITAEQAQRMRWILFWIFSIAFIVIIILCWLRTLKAQILFCIG
jgi:hypothetical protein